jgi:membrane-associated phospholipid phosphatase
MERRPEHDDGTSGRPVALWVLLCLAATALILLAVAPHDLALSLALAPHRDHPFGDLVQHRGLLPGSVLIVAAAALWTQRAWREARPRLAHGLAAVSVQLILQAALLTNGLKLLTGRPRPVALGSSGEGFRPFWGVDPGLGDFAMPSGHVAVAMILTPWVLAAWRDGRRGAALGLAIATLLWAGGVAFGRVLSGAHFPTDTLASIGLGLALAPLSLRAADRLCRRLALPRAPSAPAVDPP